MRKSKFTESQIVALLKEGGAGVPVAEVCRKLGISSPTYYAWKSKYAEATVSDLTRMRTWKPRTPGSSACTPTWRWRTRRSRTCWQKILTPSVKWQVVKVVVTEHRLSIKRACSAAGLSRAA